MMSSLNLFHHYSFYKTSASTGSLVSLVYVLILVTLRLACLNMSSFTPDSQPDWLKESFSFRIFHALFNGI